MVDISKQVTDLNAGWYNYVTQAMGIDQSNFQLAQGALGLQSTDSSGLFLMSDAVPPSASVAYYVPSGLSKRSSAYGELLQALLPETGSSLATVLADKYSSWISFRDAYYKQNAASTLSQEDVFNLFANRLDPTLKVKALKVFKASAHAPLIQAFDALYDKNAKQTFTNSAGTNYSLYEYSATIGDATSQINAGKGPVDLNFNSASASSTLKHTTAEGAATGFFDIFSGGAGASFDQLNTTAASSDFSITGTIGKYATLSTDPINWFESGEYMRAYNAKNDNTVWDPQANAGDWDSFFAQPNGSLARKVSELFLVSDYEITVTSHASYSQSDYQKITTEASFGIWPFFDASAKYSRTSQYKLNQDGSLSVTHRLNKGLIEIWGVTVADAPN